MAMGLHKPSTGSKRRYQPMAEINVTPFVDVVLVLLIVFMVAAPLLTVGVPIDLPKADAQALGEDNEPLEITITEEGVIYLQETEVPLEDLVGRLTAIAQNDLSKRIYVRGDRTLNYGQVVSVMTAVTGAGFTKVALVAEAP